MKDETVRLLHIESMVSGQDTGRTSDREAIRHAFDAACRTIHIDTLYLPTLADLARRLDSGTFDVLHFSGHSSARRGLVLSSPAGHLQALDGAGLRGLLRALKGRCPKVCVLASCHSLRLAREVAAFAQCAVGAHGDLDDVTVVQFIEVFYGGLAEGRSVAMAFERAEAVRPTPGVVLGLEAALVDPRRVQLVSVHSNVAGAPQAAPLLEEGRRLLQLHLYADAAARFRALAGSTGDAVHQGHYYLALALMRGRPLHSMATLAELREVERHVSAAACLSAEAHYYVLWAWLRRDLCRRGVYAGVPPTWEELLSQASVAAHDSQRLEELAHTVFIPATDPVFGRFTA